MNTRDPFGSRTHRRRHAPRRPGALLALGLVALIAFVAACGGDGNADASTPAPTAPPATVTTTATLTATPIATRSPTPTETSTPEPTPEPPSSESVDLLRVVGKQLALPDGYEPTDLVMLDSRWYVPGFGPLYVREQVLGPLSEMLAAADAAGLNLRARSAYRSYATQAATFAFWVDLIGEAQARRESALAGHSEHQLGTTIDFSTAAVGYELTPAFGSTAEGQWLAEHAHEYGFAMSYPPESEHITGYIHEPWHFRFIGPDRAAEWLISELVLIEYLAEINDFDLGPPG